PRWVLPRTGSRRCRPRSPPARRPRRAPLCRRGEQDRNRPKTIAWRAPRGQRLPILPARVGAASVHGEPHNETICSPTQFWSEQAMAVSMARRGIVLGAAFGLAVAIACDSPFEPRCEGERVPVVSVIVKEVTGDLARSYSFASCPTALYTVF